MLLQRDAVGLCLFENQMKKLLPARSVSSYLRPILVELENTETGNDTDIEPILHTMAERLKRKGLVISGINPERKLVEIIELKNHPFFVAAQFHPEFKSRPLCPHPLFREFIRAGVKKKA